MDFEILYIHPKSQMMIREIIPMSVPALVNYTGIKTLGRFYYEVTPAEIRHAKIILMDIHWYLSLPGAIKLAKKIRRINPQVIIVAGGITASVYAKQLTRLKTVDYVITGDAEEPLKQLVTNLLQNKPVRHLSNLVHREFHNPRAFIVTTEILDKLEYNNIDFFPTLKKRVLRYHKIAGKRPVNTQPVILPFKGCGLYCTECLGAPKLQKLMFGRAFVAKSPQRIRQELETLSADPAYTYVNLYLDIVCLTDPEYWRQIFNQKYRLNIFYSFAALPTEDGLKAIAESFIGGRLIFSLDKYHTTSRNLLEIDDLIARIKQAQQYKEYTSFISYSYRYALEDERYDAAIKRVVKETGAISADASFWWSEVPVMDASGFGSDADFERYARNKGQKYFFLNQASRIAYALQSIAPNLINGLIDRMLPFWYKLINKVDYKLSR